MDKLSSIGKGGWHPQKTGSVKGDIKSWVGRGDGGYAGARERAQAHNSTPLSALKDPSSFAPPPKHTGYYPSSDGISAEGSQPPIASGSTVSRPLPARPNATPTPVDQQTDEEETPRSGPFVVDTTGLSTAHLPKPPVKRAGTLPSVAPAHPPVRQSTISSVPVNSDLSSGAKAKKPGPPLPPRLPPRSAVAGSGPATPLSPPPSYSIATASRTVASKPSESQQATGLLNQEAIGRLGAAGVSVPGFDITPIRNVPTKPHTDGGSINSSVNTSELQSRIAALGSAAVGTRAGKPDGLGMLAAKKKPVLPPAKPALPDIATTSQTSTQDDTSQPPPVPLSTKPR